MVSHPFTFDHIPSLMIDQCPIGYSKYAIPGSARLGENISNTFTGGCHAVFMENHGIVTTGKSLPDAFHRIENLETLASVYIESLRIGKIISLTDEDVNLNQEHKHITSPVGKRHIISEQEQKNRKTLLEIVKRAYIRKQITAVSGCFSARVNETGFMITPEGMDVNDLDSNDLVFIKDGRPEQGKIPSQFSSLHHEIYRRHKFVNSICSAHPISVMAFAITGTPLESHTIPESFLMLNEIPLISFRKRIEHPEEIASIITRQVQALLIRNDCITVTGTSPFQVFDRLEVAEFTARSILNSKPIGPIKPISDQDINDLVKDLT
jgi:L-fuculose-phosphate aldolase